MNSYFHTIRNSFDFHGYAGRKEWWIFSLTNWVLYSITFFLEVLAGHGSSSALTFINIALPLFLIIPSISITCRRLNDIGKSRWLLLIVLIPLVGPFILLFYMAQPGIGNDQNMPEEKFDIIETSYGEDSFDDQYEYENSSITTKEDLDNIDEKFNKIQTIIAEKQLRPFGNRKRLCHTDNQYDVRLFLFEDLNHARLYFDEFVEYALLNPPPYCFEILLAKIYTIYDEPFGIVFPNELTDSRDEYSSWFREATLTCNDVLRNYQPADHSYGMLGQYIKELYEWTILPTSEIDEAPMDSYPCFEDGQDEAGRYPPLFSNGESHL